MSIIWLMSSQDKDLQVTAEKALTLAVASKSALHVLHYDAVSKKSNTNGFPSWRETMLNKAASLGCVCIFTEVPVKKMVTLVLNQIKEEQATLLLVNDEVPGKTHPLFDDLAQFPVPILLLTNHRWPADLDVYAAVDPLQETERPSQLDNVIVEVSKQIAKALKAKVSLVHCIQMQPLSVPHQNTIQQIHREKIRDFADFHQILHKRSHLLKGAPEDALPEFVVGQGGGILTLGLMSRSLLETFWVGSTTTPFLENPPCDLLLVTDHHFEVN